MSSHDELTARIALAMRDVIAHAVLTNERIARSIGINVVDLQTVGVILRVGPTTPSELARRTELPSSTVTRVLDRLEARGYIRRVPDPDDRRRVVVEGVAEQVFDPNRPDPYAEIIAGMRRLHARFTPDELDVVARYLEAMAAIANAPAPTD
ncbi:MAG TPA: MarR family transcriptional regulator [Aldersonia sp.]